LAVEREARDGAPRWEPATHEALRRALALFPGRESRRPTRRSTGASALEGRRRRRQVRRVELVVFGLTISSSWGNGHATLWRGLASALSRLGHSVTFFERDLPYYAPHRALFELGEGRISAVLSSPPSSLIPSSATRTRRGCATPRRAGSPIATGEKQ
jgi:hypothetical protein